MNAQLTDLQYIPLHQLCISPRNARKTIGAGVEDLAASIKAHGLLQNLGVQPSGNDPSLFEVIAGGRRLEAMHLLAQSGELPHDLAARVPCRVIHDDDLALEASTAENTLREAMHPADQFVAFKGMVDAGKSAVDVAAHFGVAELVVKQRLKLANVSPTLLDLYRKGGIQLDQLQALAITDDHTLQEKTWHGLEAWQRHAPQLRAALTNQEVRGDHILARAVGLAAYEAAGGPVRRDLFSDTVYLCDKHLLDRLAREKLEEIAEEERAAGWSWVEAHMALDYSQLSAYPHHSAPKRTAATREDEARIKSIDARIGDIKAAMAVDEQLDEAQIDGDAWEVLEDEIAALKKEREELQQGREEWSGTAKAEAGVLVYLDHHQGVRIARGRLRSGQRVDASGKVTGKAKSGSANQADAKPKRPELSDNMVRRLTMHRTLALQEEMAARPDVALQLLVTHLLTRLLTTGYGSDLLKIRAEHVQGQHEQAIRDGWSDLQSAPAMVALKNRLKALKASGLGKGGQSGIASAVAKKTQGEQLELLALCVALSVDAIHGAGHCNEQANATAELVGLDMTKWWKPDPERFIGHVPKSLLAQAVAEAKGKDAAAALATLKKDAAAAEAAKQLSGTGWLPKPLRGAGYAVKKAGQAPKSVPSAKEAKSTKASGTGNAKKAATKVKKAK